MSPLAGATWRTALLAAALLGLFSGANAVVAGIDFSGKFIKAVLVKPGSPFTIVTNPQSKRKTSANLAFYRGEREFGHDADGIGSRKPAYVFPSAHLMLGAKADDERVANLMQLRHAAHPVVPGNRSEPVFVLPDAPDAHSKFGEISMTAEMYAAQLLGYFRRIIEGQAGQSLAGAVVTVPSFWTHTERAALMQAAQLAGVNVLRLVEEPTAAAAQFGIDRVYANDTLVMVYSMGATSTQATLFRFGSYKARDGKMRGTAMAVGKGWDSTLGGDALDRALTEFAADVFNKKHGKQLGGDIRSFARPMSKLRRAVGNVKQVLSANAEFPLIIESIATTDTGDIDFRTTITRAKLLELSADLIARVGAPALQACQAAGVDPLDVEVVEIIGGGVRVPAVQEALKTALRRAERPPTPDTGVATADGEEPVPVPALGVHLNGDEAVAFGAAFIAANLSKSFRVRPVGLQDALPYGITARVFSVDEAGDSAPLRVLSLRPYGRLGAPRSVKLPADRDLVVSLEYNTTGAVAPELGTSLGEFSITGVADAAADDRVRELGLTPNVTMRVLFAFDGTVTLQSAAATARFMTTETPTPLPTADGEATTQADSDASTTAEGGADAEADVKIDGDAEPDEKSDADAKENVGGEDKEATPSPEAAANSSVEETAPPAPKPRARTLRFPLRVRRLQHPAGARPLTEEELELTATLLSDLQREDDEQAELEAVKNDLEGAIMQARDQLDEAGEELLAVTTEEQRTAADEVVMALDDWLYGDGRSADVAAARDQQAELDTVMSPIRFRIAEAQARPKAISTLRKAISKARSTVAAWEKAKPWVSTNLPLLDSFLAFAAYGSNARIQRRQPRGCSQPADEWRADRAATVGALAEGWRGRGDVACAGVNGDSPFRVCSCPPCAPALPRPRSPRATLLCIACCLVQRPARPSAASIQHSCAGCPSSSASRRGRLPLTRRCKLSW